MLVAWFDLIYDFITEIIIASPLRISLFLVKSFYLPSSCFIQLQVRLRRTSAFFFRMNGWKLFSFQLHWFTNSKSGLDLTDSWVRIRIRATLWFRSQTFAAFPPRGTNSLFFRFVFLRKYGFYFCSIKRGLIETYFFICIPLNLPRLTGKHLIMDSFMVWF